MNCSPGRSSEDVPRCVAHDDRLHVMSIDRLWRPIKEVGSLLPGVDHPVQPRPEQTAVGREQVDPLDPGLRQEHPVERVVPSQLGEGAQRVGVVQAQRKLDEAVPAHLRDYFTGRTVYHCHILDHEDAGMMGVVGVV